MTDHTPSGSQPQTAEFEDWAVSQMYAVRTDSGRLKWNSPAYEAIAKAALSAPAVETVAVQEAPHGPIDANRLEEIAKERPNERFLKGSGVLKLLGAIRQLEQENRALRASPLPVAPKAEPVAVVCDAFELRWIGSGPIAPIIQRNGIKVGTKLYATPQADSAQPVVADTPEARMFAAAVAQLAEISDALGIDPEEAACANGNDLILAAIARKNEALLAALRKKP